MNTPKTITLKMEVKGLKLNASAIARIDGLSPQTVRKRIRRQDLQKGKIIKESKLDSFKEIIIEKVDKYQVTGKAIFEYIKENGFTGSYETVKNFVRIHKSNALKEAILRVEKTPGLQAQVDWKENKKLITKNGEQIAFNIFAYVLPYSQFRYYEVTEDRTQPTLFRCIINAFNQCGGVPEEIWFDNMKTVVESHDPNSGIVVFQPKFLRFSKELGFKPIACKPYRPQTKGVVEGIVKLTNRIDVYNGEIEMVNDIKDIIKKFNITINEEKNQYTNSTGSELLKIEKEYLNHIVASTILDNYFEIETRKVTNEAMISYMGNKYSVPTKYIGKVVEIKAHEGNLNIYYTSELIFTHEIKQDRKINYAKDHLLEVMKSGPFKNKSDDELKKMVEARMKEYDKLTKGAKHDK